MGTSLKVVVFDLHAQHPGALPCFSKSRPDTFRQTIQRPCDSQYRMELFRELWNGEPIRLLGIRSSKLSDEGEPQQLSIFDIQTQKKKKKLPTRKQEQLDKALDQIRKRYGESSVVRGSSLSSLQSSISGNQGEGKEEKREEKRGEKRT